MEMTEADKSMCSWTLALSLMALFDDVDNAMAVAKAKGIKLNREIAISLIRDLVDEDWSRLLEKKWPVEKQPIGIETAKHALSLSLVALYQNVGVAQALATEQDVPFSREIAIAYVRDFVGEEAAQSLEKKWPI